MDIKQYVVPIVATIIYLIIWMVKGTMPENIRKWIPAICGVLGIVINTWVAGWNFTPAVMLGGLASGWMAVGLNETIKAAQK